MVEKAGEVLHILTDIISEINPIYQGMMGNTSGSIFIEKQFHSKDFDAMERVVQAVKIEVPVDVGKGGGIRSGFTL